MEEIHNIFFCYETLAVMHSQNKIQEQYKKA